VGGPVNQEFFGLNSMNWIKIRGGKNSEAADELILSFFEEDVLKQVFKVATSYALPAYTNQWEWEEITSVPNSIIQKEGALDPQGWNGIGYPGPGTPWIAAVGTQVVDTDMLAAVLNGQATAAEAVKQAAERAVQIFQEMGAAGVK
jgi:multiple sugar transport system substrate-binding protein